MTKRSSATQSDALAAQWNHAEILSMISRARAHARAREGGAIR
jgi:hypothetical protein